MDIETEREREREREKQKKTSLCTYIYIYIHSCSRSVRQVMKLHPLDVGGKESLSVKTSQIQSYKFQDICMQIHIKLQ